MRSSKSLGPTWSSAFRVFLVYVGLVLLFTVLGVFLAPQAAQVGGTRPGDTIPDHLAELAGFGLLLGAGSLIIYGRRGVPLVLLMPALTVALDLDHVPAYLGYAQSIRPAHSLVFVVVALAVTAMAFRQFEMDLVVVSAFMAHMAVDTGLFAPFSPISFQYFQLDPYRLPFAVAAIICVLAAGVIFRTKSRSGNAEQRAGSVSIESADPGAPMARTAITIKALGVGLATVYAFMKSLSSVVVSKVQEDRGLRGSGRFG